MAEMRVMDSAKRRRVIAVLGRCIVEKSYNESARGRAHRGRLDHTASYGLPGLSGRVLWICGTLNLLFRYGSDGEKESYEFRRLYREKNNYVVSHHVY